MGLLNHEEARIEKADGRVLGPYKALFQGKTIFILNEMADIEEGDAVLRQLPNGKDEKNIVLQATFYRKGVGSMGAHYRVEFRKGGEVPMQKPTQNITINGAGSVQVGDYNTQNIVNLLDTLKTKIEAADADPKEKEEAKGLLRKLLEHPLVVSILGAAAGAVMG